MFTCDDSRGDIVTFEGRIIGTDDRSSSSLLESMQEWLANEPTVTVQAEQVQVVNPSNKEENEDSNVHSVAIGAGIAGAILIILALAAFAVVCTMYYRYKQNAG